MAPSDRWSKAPDAMRRLDAIESLVKERAEPEPSDAETTIEQAIQLASEAGRRREVAALVATQSEHGERSAAVLRRMADNDLAQAKRSLLALCERERIAGKR